MPTRETTDVGLVVFTGEPEGLIAFYEGMFGLRATPRDPGVTVLAGAGVELVVHLLRREPRGRPEAMRDAYVKPFFVVPSLAAAYTRVGELGGRAEPLERAWGGDGFRALEVTDPDGNPVQLRERTS